MTAPVPDPTMQEVEALLVTIKKLRAFYGELPGCLATVTPEFLRKLDAVIRALRGENALARDTAFWLDCRWNKPANDAGGTVPERSVLRGASHCMLEGTHVCALCQLVDAQARFESLEAERDIWKSRCGYKVTGHYNRDNGTVGEYLSVWPDPTSSEIVARVEQRRKERI